MNMHARKISAALIAAMSTVLAFPRAADAEYPDNLEQKLGAGLVNMATGWVELIKSPVAIGKKEGIGWGMTLGPLMGVLHTAGRTGSGVFDIVTFVLPTKPMVDPPMIWQDFYRETTYRDRFEVYEH